MTSATLPDHLEVHPSVVFQLGDMLISDEVQAILELVKNAYDADATYARLVVDTTAVTGKDSLFPGCVGTVVVTDDGTGMNASEIELGWLTLANSSKSVAKRMKRRTLKFNRTPLGDKGLGRLGVQRLGYVVELATSKINIHQKVGADGSPGLQEVPEGIAYRVGIDWRRFADYTKLSQVPVEVRSNTNQRPKRGTRIAVSQLRNPSAWKGRAVDDLRRKLSQVIFPFGEVRPFKVYAEVDGEDLNLLEISDRLRNASTSRFALSYDGEVLRVQGRYKPTSFRPSVASEIPSFSRLVERDRGRSFHKYLTEDPEHRTLPKLTGLAYTPEDPWFLTTQFEKRVDQLGQLYLDDEQGFADPGPFTAEIDAFDLSREGVRLLGEGVLSDFNQVVRDQSGVRVFRDGFGIRPYGVEGNDWLGLGRGQTGGTSYYGLRPGNIIGYVALSAEHNAQLSEKTDREGFVDTPHARNFFQLMHEAVDWINKTNGRLRRGYNSFQSRRAGAGDGHLVTASSDVLYERIRVVGKGAADLGRSVSQLERTLQGAQRAAVAVADRGTAAHRADVAEIRTQLEEMLAASSRMLVDVRDHVQRAEQLEASANVLERDFARLREQMEDFAALAALGLTAESVSHELRTVAGNLAKRTRNVIAHLNGSRANDSTLRTYLDFVRSSVSAVRRQLDHLEPGLRYAREQLDIVPVRSFAEDLKQFYDERLARAGLEMRLEQPFDDFKVRINRGRLTQVVDNLLLNSQYWLSQDLASKRLRRGEAVIHVRSHRPTLEVWDDGRGIDPSLEETLFEPFVTNKPKGQGRGLGLFIARQLLESSGCQIDLAPDRNRFGNRYVFRVDLAGALHASD